MSPERVQTVIEDAFRREAKIDARHIRVEVSDHTAKLYGHVHSLHEAPAARAAAAAAPGVAAVESHLVVSRRRTGYANEADQPAPYAMSADIERVPR